MKKLKLSKKVKVAKPTNRAEEAYLDEWNPPDLINGLNVRGGSPYGFQRKVKNLSSVRKGR